MISRSEKNKEVLKKINHEKNVKRSKSLLTIFLSLILLMTAIYLYARFIGTRFIQTNEYIIQNANIPSAFHGSKILHLSDLLYGNNSVVNLDKLLEEIMQINPDIIVFTGDLIKANYQMTEKQIVKLKDFFHNMPAKIGKYAIKGENDTTTFDLIMNDSDFIVMNNEYQLIYQKNYVPIMIMGLNINNPQPLSIKNSNNYYTIALIHNFDYYQDYQITANLVLGGHNLNGEIRIPFYRGLIGNNKYNDSYYQINNTKVYISNGLGTIHNVRLFNHPSINVYRLYNH